MSFSNRAALQDTDHAGKPQPKGASVHLSITTPIEADGLGQTIWADLGLVEPPANPRNRQEQCACRRGEQRTWPFTEKWIGQSLLDMMPESPAFGPWKPKPEEWKCPRHKLKTRCQGYIKSGL